MPSVVTAVVLAGGAGRRLGGADKALITAGGQTLLDRALSSWPDGMPLIVVGPEREATRTVRWCRESPPGGGPLSAIAAALPLVDTELMALTGVDMPFIGSGIPWLLERAESSVRAGGHGAWLLGVSGRPQPLASCVRTAALREVMPQDTHGAALWPILAQLSLEQVLAPDEWLADIDTECDLEQAHKHLRHEEGTAHD